MIKKIKKHFGVIITFASLATVVALVLPLMVGAITTQWSNKQVAACRQTASLNQKTAIAAARATYKKDIAAAKVVKDKPALKLAQKNYAKALSDAKKTFKKEYQACKKAPVQPPADATSTPTVASLPCVPAPLQRQFNDAPYYTGPMFDDHFHMPQFRALTGVHASAPVLDKDVSRRDVACLFQSGRVTGAFAFYGIPSDLKDAGVNAARDIEQTYPGRIKHFLELVTFPGYPVVPTQIDAVLNANDGLFKGYGEISLYLPHYSVVSPNDPAMRELYAIAEKHHLPVMMHPIEGQQQAVEQVLHDFPNVKFLFHAAEKLSWGNTLFDADLDKYSNAYYSVDIDLFGQDAAGMPLMGSATDKQNFLTQFKQRWPDTLSQKVAYWKSKIEKHPNQFLWGTDRGTAAWNYDAEVASLLEEYSRAFIGKLDPAVQEKYAHENAEALLLR